jgi:hypothetical protein
MTPTAAAAAGGETTGSAATVKRARPRGGGGRYAVDVTATERADHALKLRAAGLEWAEVAAAAGYAGPGPAHRAVMRLLDGRTAESVDHLRQVEGAHLDRAQRELWAVVMDPGPLVSAGKVIYGSDGKPEPNRDVQVNALNALIRLSQRRARIFGMDAPSQTVHLRAEVELDSAIQGLIDQLKAGATIQGQIER